MRVQLKYSTIIFLKSNTNEVLSDLRVPELIFKNFLFIGRCVTLLLFIALTILYAAYSANIVVLLRAPSSSVRSLPDLLNSPLKLGASDFEYNRYFFKVQF